FITTIPVGTPPREFNIILDSGSGFFWVESSEDCNSHGGGCGNHTFLGGDMSSSFVNTLKPWSITYGSGFASGDLITDTVVLGGSVLNNLTFGLAHVISSEFSGSTSADGLMGLCKAGQLKYSMSGDIPTPVQTLKNTGFIDAAITSYRLPRAIDDINNGEITFGGLDYTKLDSSTLVTVEAMNDDTCFWLTQLGGVSVDGEMVALSASRTALMDTGTTLLLVPSTDLDGIHAMIPGAKRTRQGTYTVPCNTTASVALEFGGQSFPINPEDLTLAKNGHPRGDCISRISTIGTDSNANIWIVGDTFLKSVYFSTNVDANTITLARAI
ncbi:aspartic peptidase domain-containing protein, partial [Mycena leptocephala]